MIEKDSRGHTGADTTHGPRIGIISSSSVVSSGLRVMIEQAPMPGASRCTVADAGSEDGCDLLVVPAVDLGWVPPRSQARVLVVVQTLAEAFAAATSGNADVADGYVELDGLTSQVLGEAIRECLNGQYPVPPRLRRLMLIGAPTRRQTSAAVSLTEREREALGHVAEGLSNEQVARRLGISAHGAKRLIASAMLKLDAPNRTAAVMQAIRLGLLECPGCARPEVDEAVPSARTTWPAGVRPRPTLDHVVVADFGGRASGRSAPW